MLIGNSDYSHRRSEEGYAGFGDLPAVETDLENTKNGLKRLGVRDDEIEILRNADFKTMSKKLKALDLEIINSQDENKKTLLFVYYAGHGILKGYTKAVCNQAQRAFHVFFPLEQQLRTIATQPGAYVIGVFDCCRADF